MKYIKKFNEDIERSIEYWCKEFNIRNYTINDNETVDVNDGVDISHRNLLEIPIQFGVIEDHFQCGYNNLTSLNNSPFIVKSSFLCGNNQLTNLIGGPKEVSGDFYCRHNQLISLEGYPKELGGSFYCSNNPIFEIYKLFNNNSNQFNSHSYKNYMYSLDYNYLRGSNIIKSRFQEACDEAGVKMPESIYGYKYI